MNTLLITTQIVCYGVGIVSASLNIATFVRRRHVRLRRLRAAAQSRLCASVSYFSSQTPSKRQLL
jgi:hypothetical protein